ncbi:hypothetical protein ZWY2020_054291 [Hordeum vulgare]|nr:hypothetical protein ZWY2020_054291 [Hordeum vulgare]
MVSTRRPPSSSSGAGPISTAATPAPSPSSAQGGSCFKYSSKFRLCALCSAAASPPNGDQAGTGNIASGSHGATSGSQSSVGTTIGDSFNAEVRQQADAHIARMFFTTGLPFNLARNPNFRAAISFVVNNSLGGQLPLRER